ncbi:hypothetical protein [Sulfidibacter corallicola]|uniref:Uncharacterized protein n=1 Tax=Sulfidibacter corallicola TaxID=2818388 RepID=A0A8A4TKT1_SULCO|nr:hypothetical protein [Sulfidibacter corallicola]QTD50150.1 hypothetical protein J3U87_31585 [Sulfidibacter corallicola]
MRRFAIFSATLLLSALGAFAVSFLSESPDLARHIVMGMIAVVLVPLAFQAVTFITALLNLVGLVQVNFLTMQTSEGIIGVYRLLNKNRSFWLGLWLGVVVGASIGMHTESYPNRLKIEKTEALLQELSTDLHRHYQDHGTYPEPDPSGHLILYHIGRGERKVDIAEDAFGRPLRYETSQPAEQERSWFRLTSQGVDPEQDADDLVVENAQ